LGNLYSRVCTNFGRFTLIYN